MSNFHHFLRTYPRVFVILSPVLPLFDPPFVADLQTLAMSAVHHTLVHIYAFSMHIRRKGGIFVNKLLNHVRLSATLDQFSLLFCPVILAVHAPRTSQLCIFLSLFVTFDEFPVFFLLLGPPRILRFCYFRTNAPHPPGGPVHRAPPEFSQISVCRCVSHVHNVVADIIRQSFCRAK